MRSTAAAGGHTLFRQTILRARCAIVVYAVNICIWIWMHAFAESTLSGFVTYIFIYTIFPTAAVSPVVVGWTNANYGPISQSKSAKTIFFLCRYIRKYVLRSYTALSTVHTYIYYVFICYIQFIYIYTSNDLKIQNAMHYLIGSVAVEWRILSLSISPPSLFSSFPWCSATTHTQYSQYWTAFISCCWAMTVFYEQFFKFDSTRCVCACDRVNFIN